MDISTPIADESPADSYVEAAIMKAAAAGISAGDLAVSLLVGAFVLAKRSMHADDWAGALEAGAQIIRDDEVRADG